MLKKFKRWIFGTWKERNMYVHPLMRIMAPFVFDIIAVAFWLMVLVAVLKWFCLSVFV